MAALVNLATAGLFLLLSFTLSQGFSFASKSPLSCHWRRAQTIQSYFKSRETGGAITSTHTAALRMSASTAAATVPSWSDLKTKTQLTKTGSALTADAALRKEGKGAPHRENTLRLFGDSSKPTITLFRDHAAWCPYCEKTMLLVEEKQIPINVNLVNMRSYGDKPREFLQKVPNGLLPALEMPNGQIVTESQVIMELLDEMHSGKTMLPQQTKEGWSRYDALAKLERELFSWWCTLLFRPAGIMGGIFSPDKMSGAMKGFLECIGRVDKELSSTKGPWFFDEYDYPTMIDFIYVSHIERMLASCAYWQGLNLRDVQKWNLKGLNNWLDAFDKRESYLAFKSDYYTNVKDIPPQYGPGYDGGFEQDRNVFQKNILGQDGSWTLPISHDDLIQPLYRGPPLPLCVLEATDLKPNDDGSYESCDPVVMAKACREMAAWKLADNGINVSRFAARGGPAGAKNPRKTFGAELADPYADPDDNIRPVVDAALRCVCDAMLDDDTASLDGIHKDCLLAVVPTNQAKAVVSSMVYLRDRVGVPRDLPLAAARYLRAYLNWGIDVLS